MSPESKKQPFELPASYEGADIKWLDDQTLRCKGVQLCLTSGFNIPKSSEETVTLFKDPRFIRGYVEQLDGFRVDNMVEVGIWDGGSAIFFWNLLRPSKLCCIELKKNAEQLSAYIERENLGEKFRVHFGVDQADRARVMEVMDAEFPGTDVDLVIDDASHLYTPSKATFEVLFPRLRQGGLYFLEDWKANLLFPHLGGGEDPDFPPFHQLVFELLEVSMRAPDIIPSVRSFHNFVIIERGTEPLDSAQFTLDQFLSES